MRFALAVAPLLCCRSITALFEDDAGKLDFLISTTGHGPINYVKSVGDSVITSSTESCHVASRSIETGALLWRRNVCSSGNTHSTTVSGTTVVTADASGSVRGWSVDDGALLWDTVGGSNVWTVNEHAVAVSGRSLTVINSASGQVVDISKKKAEAAKPLKEDETTVTCAEQGDLKISLESGNLVAKRGTAELATMAVSAQMVSLLKCDKTSASVLVTSSRGTTTQVTFSNDLKTMWTTEEGLAQISAALMLDASHEDFIQQEKSLLELSSRLALQYKSLSKILSPERERRDHAFGFVKIAVLLSDSANRIFGIETTGPARATIRYQVDLPENAVWHRLIHGSTNSGKSTHGINGVVHTREVLVLSLVGQHVDWLCIEGTSGKVHAKGSVPIGSQVIQVIALAGKGACRQGALLMLKDESLISVPADNGSLDSGGLYAHALHKKNAGLESFKILATSKGLESHHVGSAVFPGEEIIAVSYPAREEVMQSPCNVLGDDSLLLKYLNPHLAVIVTTGNAESDADAFSLAPKKKSTQKRKPTGVTPPGEEVPKVEENPNLFVNLVDTVSGRILYRASHANALASPRPSVLVSENWVFYSFTNEKTKKAELGVLSMYEGMIDSKGLTAFTSPVQSTSFSSLDARETKPVVLAKTFSIPNPVTALGMTSTRAGISGRRLLLAGIDGQLHAIDRKMLEPRRPLGQLKDSEKKEGLVQYHELIQTVSYMSLSYNQTIESVRAIVTAPTDLESQSLVLAFGGPDIFFARTSPSRGFDLLPDSFNKIALSIVLAGLVAILVVMQRMVSKKINKQGWV